MKVTAIHDSGCNHQRIDFCKQTSDFLFAVGSDSSEEKPGIYLCRLDAAPNSSGKPSIQILGQTGGIGSPTWLEPDAERRLIYTGGLVNGQGVVAAYQIKSPCRSASQEKDAAGRDVPFSSLRTAGPDDDVDARQWQLQTEGTLPVSGGPSCHQALDARKEFLAVSFYSSGSLSLVRLNEQGRPIRECDHIVHTGHSVHPLRQREAHVHFSAFIGDFLYCCDLGEDRIYEYYVDREKEKLVDTGKVIQTPPGRGPRHLVYNAATDLLYVVTEMGGSVCVFSRQEGRLLQEVQSIPEDVDRSKLPVIDYDAYGAAIHWWGQEHILVSNRGQDTISLFKVQADGLLTRQFTGPVHGRIPRDFGILGHYLVCANQTSNDLTVLEMDPSGEAFHDTGCRLELPCPTRILPLENL